MGTNIQTTLALAKDYLFGMYVIIYKYSLLNSSKLNFSFCYSALRTRKAASILKTERIPNRKVAYGEMDYNYNHL